MQTFLISPATTDDHGALAGFYRTVAAVEGGLARTADEITEEYVAHFLKKSLAGGVILVARQSATGEIIGEIHAYALGPKVFAHVLGELTIAVHPAHQGRGIGKALFTELLAEVTRHRPDILRVELIARESNQKAIALYEKLGFRVEGRFAGRIRSTDGGFEADIPMAWHRNHA
ncbi:MAG TPA: GNAT family N-acetyltransferase [Blastocatellia bacterium]|nr:GNAT family N-acetyltransferase [Blastocatellia bacterium]HMZ19400.1 GNAT family N-acetyltransferase [Blastocatellia bacterium]HNG31085.1 GNAT family N-acetyltransferase [Blastocatellia bacterium]